MLKKKIFLSQIRSVSLYLWIPTQSQRSEKSALAARKFRFFCYRRRRHTRCGRDRSSDVCSSDLDRVELALAGGLGQVAAELVEYQRRRRRGLGRGARGLLGLVAVEQLDDLDRKS